MARRKRKKAGVPWVRYIRQPNDPDGGITVGPLAIDGNPRFFHTFIPGEWIQMHSSWCESALNSNQAHKFEFSDTDPT